jgi:hypothetical protein
LQCLHEEDPINQQSDLKNPSSFLQINSIAANSPPMTPQTVIPQRPQIFAFPPGTLLTGTSNLTLKCILPPHTSAEGGMGMDEMQNNNINNNSAIFTWYKNNRELKEIAKEEDQRQLRIIQVFFVNEKNHNNVFLSISVLN